MKRPLLVCGLLFSILRAGPAVLPSVADTITIRDWLVCGPFPIGMREGITGVVEDPASFRPHEGDTFRSSMVQGGITSCRKIRVDSLGMLEVKYDSVRWDSLQEYYGNAGIYCAGYAYAEFDCPKACRALALTPKLGGFVLNGLGYPGDVYGNGWLKVPVALDSGTNRVLLTLSGYGDDRVGFKLAPAPSPIVIARDFTTPDLVESESLSSWLGIPLVNTTDERIDEVHLKVSRGPVVMADTMIRNIPALGAKKVPVRITLPAQKFDSLGVKLVVSVTSLGTRSGFEANPVMSPGIAASETIRLDIKHPDQPRKVTFISKIDGSCQYYAIMEPTGIGGQGSGVGDKGRKYALIFSTHGAGVEAIGQAGAYKAKDWAFVVAATNRRPFGFNWQDWGRLDGMEVLDQVTAKYPIDPNRVLLTGHSMGGHGVWHLATTGPDRFAAAAAEAGWPSIQLYVPWFLQRSINFAEPGQLAIRDMALRNDNPLPMLVNCLDLPVFILHGGDDDNVPTLHGRNFAEWLKELGYRCTYKEVPGRKHWWDYESLKVSVVDDPDAIAFLKQQQRDPFPRHIRFRTADLGQANRDYWARIERVQTLGRDAELEAWASDSLIRLKTANITQLSLNLAGAPWATVDLGIEIDGTRLPGRFAPDAEIVLAKVGQGWRTGPGHAGKLAKTPGLYGPAKQVMMSPFVLVYGTLDSGSVRFLRHAANQEALRWWPNGNGLAEVLPDTEVTPELIERCNLVLYGGTGENRLVGRIGPRLPVQMKGGAAWLGRKNLGDSLAALVIYPNPLNPNKLVLVRMGTDPQALRLSTFFGIAGPSTGVPDFMIFDRSVRRYGWAGVRAAGFFDSDWQIDPASMYLKE